VGKKKKVVGFRSKGRGKSRIVYPLTEEQVNRIAKLHSQRKSHAQIIDESLEAKPPVNYHDWVKNPNRRDVQGVDLPKSQKQDFKNPREVKRYRLWIKRLKKAGMRDPTNPHRSLHPTHVDTRRQIEKLEIELAMVQGKLTLREYHKKHEQHEKKFKHPYLYKWKDSDGKTRYSTKSSAKKSGTVWGFDLTDVQSKTAWEEFLKQNTFRLVDSAGKYDSHVFENNDGILLVISHRPVKTRKGNDVSLGYVHFNAPSGQSKKLKKVLTDFRGKRPLTFPNYEGKTWDYLRETGDIKGGIATYVKGESPRREV
jgi:hypothetical protein